MSRGLGDVYKRQIRCRIPTTGCGFFAGFRVSGRGRRPAMSRDFIRSRTQPAETAALQSCGPSPGVAATRRPSAARRQKNSLCRLAPKERSRRLRRLRLPFRAAPLTFYFCSRPVGSCGPQPPAAEARNSLSLVRAPQAAARDKSVGLKSRQAVAALGEGRLVSLAPLCRLLPAPLIFNFPLSIFNSQRSLFLRSLIRTFGSAQDTSPQQIPNKFGFVFGLFVSLRHLWNKPKRYGPSSGSLTTWWLSLIHI